MTKNPTVLVTGATGRVGGSLVRQLAGTGAGIRALTRNPVVTSLGEAVEIVHGDLAQPETVSPALDGVDAVFLVFPSVAADASARELVATLTESVRRIVYLSSFGVPDEPDTSAEPDGGIIGSHAHLEGLIAGSAAEYTMLRPVGFAANTLTWAEQIRRSDVVRWYLPRLSRPLIHEDDIAAAGLRALLDDGHDRKAHVLTGPERLTQVEQLAAIADVLGRPLRFEECPTETVVAELFSGLPDEMVDSIVKGQEALLREPEPVTDTVERLTGRPALSFARWARDHAADFGR